MRSGHPLISVVVADDHPVVLQGLVSLLRSCPDFKVVAECRDGRAAVKAIEEFAPSVAVLDMAMPGLNGLEVLLAIGRGRDEDCSPPPARIPACAANAPGSSLG